MRLAVLCLAIAFCWSQQGFAQDLVGTWQGTIGSRQHVLKVTKDGKDRLHGEFFNLGPEVSGETLNGNPISLFALKNTSVQFDLDRSRGSFEGAFAADDNSISGTWTTRGKPQPLTLSRAPEGKAWVIDPTAHAVSFVSVDKSVQVEVIDWGGSGPPLVFVPGLGNTAHVFDSFAPQFTDRYHVYGITRRGFGVSTWPEPSDLNYDSDRLGDDVLAVIAALKLDRPVVIGHSIAGAELSSIGTRYPEKVAGLVYLDASYAYAYYDPEGDTLNVDSSAVRRILLQLQTAPPSQARALIEELQATVPRLQERLQLYQKELEGMPDMPPSRPTLSRDVSAALLQNMRKYRQIKGPVLAIAVFPGECGTNCESPGFKAAQERVRRQLDAFEAGTPSARVVRIPQANHYVWRSHEADVVRDLNAFLAEVTKK